MVTKYDGTDYMYASARVRAMESQLVSRDRQEHMVEAKSSSDVMAMLSDHGFTTVLDRDDGTGELLQEDTLMSVLVTGYGELDKMTENASPATFLRYPYDCNNVKTVIKSFRRGISPDPLLFAGVGTVSADMIKEAFRDKRYELLPPYMAAAVPEAMESFSKTGNPQKVDLILDRACYADMLKAAQDSGVALAVRYMETKIDLTNLMTCVRLIRMELGALAHDYLAEAFLEGGRMERELLERALDSGEELLADSLRFGEYGFASALLEEHVALNRLEREFDDRLMDVARDAKFVPFGAEVLLGYAVALENEVKNIRIILAGKDAGLPPDVIRERLRKCYV